MCSVVLFLYSCVIVFMFFFFKQKTAYEMRISDWSSDVCSSDLISDDGRRDPAGLGGLSCRDGGRERPARIAARPGRSGVDAGGSAAVLPGAFGRVLQDRKSVV